LNDYELVAILNPEIGDEDINGTVERITQYIANRGGDVQNVDQWGRRRLAYPIDRQIEGTYVVTHFRLPPANAAELEANLRISEDVIRHLLVRYSPAEQAAAIAASQRRRPRPVTEETPGEGDADSEAAVPETEAGATVEAPADEAQAAAEETTPQASEPEAEADTAAEAEPGEEA
jgi:small subunit ribosomal protein S6